MLTFFFNNVKYLDRQKQREIYVVKYKKEIRVGSRRIYVSLKYKISAKIASMPSKLNLQNRLPGELG